MGQSDYESLPPSTTLSFATYQRSKSCMYIHIVDHCTVEETERFGVDMQRTPGLLSLIKLDEADALVYITDNINDRKIFLN